EPARLAPVLIFIQRGGPVGPERSSTKPAAVPAHGKRSATTLRLCPNAWLKQLEIFALLPLRDLGVIARELGLLDAQEGVDEIPAEALGKAGIVAQRGERLLQGRG